VQPNAWQWGVTTAIAVAGLALGVFNAMTQRRDKAARIRVTVQDGMVVVVPGVGASNPKIMVRASNVGQIPVTLSTQGFAFPKQGGIVNAWPAVGQKLPYEVLPGKSVDTVAEPYEVAKALKDTGRSGSVRLRGHFTDQVGRVFYSKWFLFDVDKALAARNDLTPAEKVLRMASGTLEKS
jgi:hypothetical protein